MANETAKLILENQEIELPVITGSEGEKGIDISKLRSQTGYITLDPAYGNTGSCLSSITFINGEKGILRYRGYPLDQLADKLRFTDIAYLLIWGKLPTKNELNEFRAKLTEHSYIHEDMLHFFNGFPSNAHPMAILTSMVASLSSFYPKDPNMSHEEMLDLQTIQVLAKVKTMAAFSLRKSRGLPIIYPCPRLNYVENILHMFFGTLNVDYDMDPVFEKALNLTLILHADHEQNCSTSSVRMVGSSQADVFATVAAGNAALWGPLHGGANQRVLEMLAKIQEAGGDYAKFIEKAKDKNDPFKLFGFGHRVYKNFDPRAKILSKVAGELLDKMHINDPLLDIARELERVALEDDYFKSRNLYPNVDFYSGIILKAMKIPVNMFTVIFALGRLPGWLAQYREMILDPTTRISRPRQIYTGFTKRDLKD